MLCLQRRSLEPHEADSGGLRSRQDTLQRAVSWMYNPLNLPPSHPLHFSLILALTLSQSRKSP